MQAVSERTTGGSSAGTMTAVPTTAEFEAALTFTADGHTDDDGEELITAARAAVAAAEAATPFAACPRVAAAKGLLAEADHDEIWSVRLKVRNDLVDFINKTAAAWSDHTEGLFEHLRTAENFVGELEELIDAASEPDALPAKAGLALRRNHEGLDVSGDWPALVQQLFDATQPAQDLSWAEIKAEYEAALEASDMACDYEYEADGDEVEFQRRSKANAPIYRRFIQAREALTEIPAPHWSAVAAKIDCLLLQYGAEDSSDGWAESARELKRAAEMLGNGAPGDADVILFLTARCYAEQMAHRAVNRPDGYANWACDVGAISRLAALVEIIVRDTRELSKFSDRHRMLSGEATSTIWFSKDTIECEVERLADEFSGAIRTHDALDGKEANLTSQETAALAAADDALCTVRTNAFAHLPRNRSGVAFQLLVAASHLDFVQHATSDDADTSAKLIRTAIANALRVLGLPFDYRAAQYFLGPVADDLGGRARPGPAK